MTKGRKEKGITVTETATLGGGGNFNGEYENEEALRDVLREHGITASKIKYPEEQGRSKEVAGRMYLVFSPMIIGSLKIRKHYLED